MTAKTLPFCSKECAERAGLLEDENGNVTGKCPCRTGQHQPTAKDAAMSATASSNPNALAAAMLIIRDYAQARSSFTSNDCREVMAAAQVPGPVVGVAFSKAAKEEWIMATGDYVASTDAATHGHPVKVWASRICKRVAS